MADPRRLATALAPFHQFSKHLQATQARLSALLAAVAGGAVARTGDLERLPAAARFNPFAVAVPFNPFTVLPEVFEPATTADPGAKARGRRADRGSRAAPGATARTGASAALAGAADSLPQAPGRAPDLPPSAAALALAATAANTQARPAGAEPLASRPASEHAAHVQAAGELIEALLQRHAPPRAATRLHGIGARSAPARYDGDAAPARHTVAASAAGAAQAADVAADHPAARGAVVAPGGDHGDAAPSRLHAASAPWGERAAMRTATGMDAAPMDAPALKHGDAVLRSLLDSVPPRPATGTQALDGVQPEPLARAPTRSPLQRAPSRLLAAVGTTWAAQPPAAAAASLHAATQMPSASAPGDSATDLATGLERLLREQAWLRGVDLT